MKTGSADLPLHGGHCPPSLFEDMKDLGEAMVEAMLLEFDRDEVLRRFADPGWFQAFGCTLGFDWHSSGLTTVVLGALKESINPRADELGLYLAGGKGATSRKTPVELEEYAEESAPGLPVETLQNCSRRTAQVDSSALQDGFDLYHHVFLVGRDGNWSVVQQGIDSDSGWARRYHWHNASAGDFLDNPHEGIVSDRVSTSLNLADGTSTENRSISVDMVREDPVKTLQEFNRLLDFWDDTSRRLQLPDRHALPQKSHLERSLGELYESPPESFTDLIGRDGIGRKTVRALSMVAEVVWGAEPSYEDPARYSFAHGGKDGYPHPVDRKRYHRSIDVLSEAIRRSKLGDDSKMKAFNRLVESFHGSNSKSANRSRNSSRMRETSSERGEDSASGSSEQLSLGF